MRAARTTRAPRTACVLALGLVLLGCTSEERSPEPEAADLPAVESFREGTCSLVAPDVLAVGGALPRLGGGGSVDPGVGEELREAQMRLAGVAETAEPALKPALDDLVIKIGIVRIRAVGNTYETAQGTSLKAAYDVVVDACTTPG